MANKFVKDLVSCTELGGLLNSTIQVRGFNDFSEIAEKLYFDLMAAIDFNDFPVTGYSLSGHYGCGKIELFNSSNTTRPHEEFHKEVDDKGLSKPSGVQTIVLEESMAHAIGNTLGNKKIIKSRSEAAEQLFPFYMHALRLSPNGGLKQTDVEHMEVIIGKCNIAFDYNNWAAFVHTTKHLGAYTMCIDLIGKYGVERAKEYVFRAMRRIKRDQDLNAGYRYLKKVLNCNGKKYPVWRKTSISNFENLDSGCRIFVEDNKKEFNFGLWTYDRQITKCVTDVFIQHAKKLSAIRGRY